MHVTTHSTATTEQRTNLKSRSGVYINIVERHAALVGLHIFTTHWFAVVKRLLPQEAPVSCSFFYSCVIRCDSQCECLTVRDCSPLGFIWCERRNNLWNPCVVHVNQFRTLPSGSHSEKILWLATEINVSERGEKTEASFACKDWTITSWTKSMWTAEHDTSNPWKLICFYKQPSPFWFLSFHQILEPGSRDLLPFSHMSISEVDTDVTW